MSFIGDIEAIRDWYNASLYNKEEIEDLFIQNDSGLQAYDLTISNGEPERMIKMIGQTSGKVYNVCLSGILGDNMRETVLWTNPGSTNPSTIILSDAWTNYKFIVLCGKKYSSTYTLYWADSNIYPTSYLKHLIDNNVVTGITMSDSDHYVDYKIDSGTQLTFKAATSYIIDQIIGYK